MKIIIIVAMAKNRVIGHNNKLPWHIPEDLKLFKKATMGYPMIMGRNTYKSLPAPLPGRRHIVLSRNNDYLLQGGNYAPSLPDALEMCSQEEKVFIVGGAQIYKLALERATTIVLSLLEREVEGDVTFPEFSEEIFIEQDRKYYPHGKEPFTVVTYQRRIPH